MKGKQGYELSQREWETIQGIRAGCLPLPKEPGQVMVRLTKNQARFLEYLERLESGAITVEVVHGEAKRIRASIKIQLDDGGAQ